MISCKITYLSFLGVLILFAALQTTVEAKEINLKWKEISEAKSYNLELSKDNTFTETILQKNLKATVLKYDIKSGIYFMRVQAVDQLGRNGLWSKPFRLVITPPITPIEQAQIPKSVPLSTDPKAEIESSWKAPERSPASYKVTIEKDGKEFLSKTTEKPQVNFKPSETGEYKVKVSARLGKFYGPSVTVQTLRVEKSVAGEAVPKDLGHESDVIQKKRNNAASDIALAPPSVQAPEHKRWSSRKPVNLKWQPVEGAKTYTVKVYRLAEGEEFLMRGPSSVESVVAEYPMLTSPDFKIPPLKPGRYVASVEANGINNSSSESSYKFEVRKAKPVDFEKFDFGFRYKFNQINYSTNIPQNSGSNSSSGSQTKASSSGGAVQLDGTFFFPDSDIGLRTSVSWGGYLISNVSLTYSDLSFAATYLLLKPTDAWKLNLRPFLGARALTMPITAQNSGTSSGVSAYSPTAIGPQIGFDISRAFSEHFSAVAMLQAFIPQTFSSIGSGGPKEIDRTKINSGFEVGLRYSLANNFRLLALVGSNSNKAQWTQSSGNSSGANNNNNGSQYAEININSFIVGVETSDDASSSVSLSDTSVSRKQNFSRVNLTAKYIYMPSTYSEHLQEVLSGSVGTNSGNGQGPATGDFTNAGLFGGSAEIESIGWLRNSNQGFRFKGGWQGLSINGNTISYPEFYGQWGLQLIPNNSAHRFQVSNYFGLRAWGIPYLVSAPGSTNDTIETPQLIGPAETVMLSYGLGQRWLATGSLEVSTPLTVANRDSQMDRILQQNLSSKAELGVSRGFTEDFSASLGLGIRHDQLRYAPPNSDNSQTSTIQVLSPTVSLSAGYSF